MILSDRDLRAAIDTGLLAVDPFDPEMIQPGSIDLRLGRQIRSYRAGLGIVDTRDPAASLTELWDIPPGRPWLLTPGAFALASTMETVSIAPALSAWIVGKSTLGRLGLIVETAGWADPGFGGQLTLELKNVSDMTLRVWPGQPVAQLVVATTHSPAQAPYGSPGVGRYQGQMGPTDARAA